MIKILVRKQYFHLILLSLLFLISSISSVAFTYFVGRVMDTVIEILKMGTDTQKIKSEFVITISFTLGVLVFMLLTAFLLMLQQSYSEIVFKLNVANRFLGDIDNLEVGEAIRRYNSNKLFARLYNDLEQCSASVFNNVTTSIQAILNLLTSLVFLTTLDLKLTVLIVLAASLSQPIVFFTKKFIERAGMRYSATNEEFSNKLQNTLNSYKSLYFSRRLDLLPQLTRTYADKQAEASANLSFTRNIVSWFNGTLSSIFSFSLRCLMILLMLYKTFGNKLTPGMYTVVVSLFSSFNSNLSLIFNSIVNQKALRLIANKFIVPLPSERIKEDKEFKRFETIRLKNLSFKYGNKTVFNKFNLELKAGKRYAIVGPSGSGKSTLLRLLMGLEEGYEGDILINGTSYHDISAESLRPLIAYCPVDIHIFNATVNDNVTLWESGDTEKALIDANLLDEIKEKGFSSSALGLSEGQKQRVGLARALFLERPILVLDETFANLDSTNVLLIKERLASMAEKTIIIVSHHINKNDTFFDEIAELGR